MTATDLRPIAVRDPHRARRDSHRIDEPTDRRSDEGRRPASAVAAEATGSATETWWNGLGADAREAARRVARCGGYLPAELSHPLVQAGVPILMPDDVRRYVQHHTT